MKNEFILYTIGYEGRKIDEFIDNLKCSQVNMLIDVRELPLSRKKGFSKNKLKDKLEKEGLKYVHMRGLGSPKELRTKLVKDKNYSLFFQSFSNYLDSKSEYLNELAKYVNNSICCLMCFERHAEKCHRSVIADKLQDLDNNGLKIINL